MQVTVYVMSPPSKLVTLWLPLAASEEPAQPSPDSPPDAVQVCAPGLLRQVMDKGLPV